MSYWRKEHIERIAAAIKLNEFVIFFGSGVSASNPLPVWPDMIQRFVDEWAKDGKKAPDEIASMKAFVDSNQLSGLEGLRKANQRIFDNTFTAIFSPNPDKYNSTKGGTNLLALGTFGFVTTNYDFCFQKSFREARPGAKLNPFQPSKANAAALSTLDGAVLYQIHGTAQRGSNSVVLTSSQYEDCYRDGSDVKEFLYEIFSKYLVVFVGFGFNDQYILRILERFGPLSRSTSRYTHLGILGAETDVPQSTLDIYESLWNTEIVTYKIERSRGGVLRHDKLNEALEELKALLDAEISGPISYAPCPSLTTSAP